MGQFAKFLLEGVDNKPAGDLNAIDFGKKVEEIMTKHFPKSYNFSKHQTNLGSNVYAFFTAGKKDQWPNNISDNDALMTKLIIYGWDKDGTPTGKTQLDPVVGGRIPMGKDDHGVGSDWQRVGLIKKTGTQAQVLNHIDKYFTKLREIANKSENEYIKSVL